MLVESVTISRRDFDAAIFDLDGVLTDTARVHAAAWKAVFDTFLQRWAQRRALAFQPFDIKTDYLDYVDGRPRDDGIRSFLAARGINLPEGSEHDPEDANTVHALGERKTRLFLDDSHHKYNFIIKFGFLEKNSRIKKPFHEMKVFSALFILRLFILGYNIGKNE
jgi:beta-phosphoglucomutase-like phosphatase (HAD superfamily)